MKKSSVLILSTYFPAFSHKDCGKNTFSRAVDESLKKDLEGVLDSPVEFVPDGWLMNSRRREFCILEIEDTNPLSDKKRNAIGRLLWWLDDNMWHLHLIRVNVPSMAFFFMNCDDVAAWDLGKPPAREWHFEETLIGVRHYLPLCEGKGSLRKREAYPSLLGNLGALTEGTIKRLFRPRSTVSL